MNKKISFLGGLVACWIQAFAALQPIMVELVNTQDLSQEKALFTSFYKMLYKDMQIENLDLKLTQKFESEKSQIGRGLVALHAQQGDKVVAYVVLKPLAEDKLRIMSCSLDMTASKEDIAQALINFVFKTFPTVTSIFDVFMKHSPIERALLTEFGFKECAHCDNTYDPESHTTVVLVKPV